MRHFKLISLALTAGIVAGCDQKKAAIEDKRACYETMMGVWPVDEEPLEWQSSAFSKTMRCGQPSPTRLRSRSPDALRGG